MPRASYATAAEIPENLKDEYEEHDGKMILKVEGDHPRLVQKARLDEFRTNNITLQKKLDDLKDIDPAEFRRLKEEVGKKGSSESQEEYNRRLAAAMEPVTKERDEFKKANERLTGEISKLKISDAAIQAGVALGLRKSATEDLSERVSKAFKLEDGKPVCYDSNGEKIYGANGLLTVDEYVKKLLDTAPHLFENSGGTGAGSGSGSGGGTGGGSGASTGLNPWKSEHWNLTLQGEIIKKDPRRAEALAAAAGKRLKL